MLLVEVLMGELSLPREVAADLIDFGSVHVNGRQERDPLRPLSGGEEVRACWPWRGIQRDYRIDPRRILYRDRWLLAYHKEAGIPSQQTPADAYNNVFAGMERHLAEEGGRPYVALHHRLDRETSGVMLFALDRCVNRLLGEAFHTQQIVKDYLLWVEGCPQRESWLAAADIGRGAGRYRVVPQGQGKIAVTYFQVLCTGNERSFLWARPRTGRTHQIRLHLEDAGHPVVGDRVYGSNAQGPLLLHAYRLSLRHPVSGRGIAIVAPLPAEWPECAAGLHRLAAFLSGGGREASRPGAVVAGEAE
jgi:23S rRNA pseudouridine1911/1915/1917 synthase